MNETTTGPKSFKEKSSFTADSAAYARTKSGIPQCRRISTAAEQFGEPIDAKEMARIDGRPDIIAYMEARYMWTDQALKESGFRQILELASGLSPRGFNMAEYPNVEYVEMDLPKKIAHKQRVLDELYRLIGARRYANHYLVGGDVANADDMLSAESYFTSEPVFIICEGLLRYLSWPDKEKLALNVRRIMERHPGSIWATTDIHLLSDVDSSPDRQKHHEETIKDWGIDVRPNLFRDLEHAHEFFRQFGIFIKERSIADMARRLASPKNLGMTDEAVAKALDGRKAFVMTI